MIDDSDCPNAAECWEAAEEADHVAERLARVEEHLAAARRRIESLVADMRDASNQLEALDGDARDVGRWLRGRVQSAVVDSPR